MNWTDKKHAEIARRLESEGTMTAEELARTLNNMWHEPNEDRQRDLHFKVWHHHFAQGATVATLQESKTEALRERDRLHVLLTQAEDDRDAAQRTVATLQARHHEAEQQALANAARAADMEMERDSARAEVERLRAEKKNLEEYVLEIGRALRAHPGFEASVAASLLKRAETAESRLAAVRESLEQVEGEKGLARWAPEGSKPKCDGVPEQHGGACSPGCVEHGVKGGAPQVQDLVETTTISFGMAGQIPTVIKSVRYPCSLTCTHDDAAKPGHPGRVRLLSGEVSKVTGLEGTVTETGPGQPPVCPRCQRRFPGAKAAHGGEPCDVPLPGSSGLKAIGLFSAGHAAGVVEGLEAGRSERAIERSEAFKSELELEAEHPEAFAAGAEAMRAACWEAVQHVLQVHGGHGAALERDIKAAIEGATP